MILLTWSPRRTSAVVTTRVCLGFLERLDQRGGPRETTRGLSAVRRAVRLSESSRLTSDVWHDALLDRIHTTAMQLIRGPVSVGRNYRNFTFHLVLNRPSRASRPLRVPA
jgi:hypothetical protein